MTAACEKKEQTVYKRCAVCGGGNHISWSTACPVRVKEMERLRLACGARARLYPVPERERETAAGFDFTG